MSPYFGLIISSSSVREYLLKNHLIKITTATDIPITTTFSRRAAIEVRICVNLKIMSFVVGVAVFRKIQCLVAEGC